MYKFPKYANDNGYYYPENKCFCKKTCLPPGMLDVRECYYGFPIALSYPHFYEMDPSFVSDVDGLKPDRRKHETYFVIEPVSLYLIALYPSKQNMLNDTRVRTFNDLSCSYYSKLFACLFMFMNLAQFLIIELSNLHVFQVLF